jgi:hypothetical protein
MGCFPVQVKKVAGVGTPANSSIVNGVVCRKNIAHKRMRRRIENAKILLIGGSVEFNRTQSRLASLESVTKQQVRRNVPTVAVPACMSMEACGVSLKFLETGGAHFKLFYIGEDQTILPHMSMHLSFL